MAFFDQLKLLVWKNFKLKLRQKIRVIVEILWPLFLFIILVLVRSRPDLRQNKHECHYDGKAMPSAGVLPFTQGLVCTMTNKCQRTMTDDERAGSINNFNNSLFSQVLRDFETTIKSNTKRRELRRLLEDFNTITKLVNQQRRGNLSTSRMNISQLVNDPDKLMRDINKHNITLSRADMDELMKSTLNISAIMGEMKQINGSYHPSVLRAMSGLRQVLSGLNGNSPDQSVDTLKKRLCDHRQFTKYVIMKNETAAQELQKQICTLSRKQMMELYRDMRSQVNQKKLIKEFSRYTLANTGNKLKYDVTLYNTMRNIARDIRNLGSLKTLLDHLNSTAQEVRAVERDKNRTERIGDLSHLICGRRDSFMQNNAEKSNLQKLVDRFKNHNHKLQDEGNEDDEDMTPFCRGMIKSLNSSTFTHLLWLQIKPMIRGTIAYAPNTPAIRAIIKKANATFEQFGHILNLLEDWVNSVGNISNVIDRMPSQDEMTSYHEMCKQYGKLDNRSSDVCENMTRYFQRSYWERTINETTRVVTLMRNYLQCFRINRFTGYATEDELVADSIKYIVNNTFWAAVVFDVSSKAHENDTLPSHIKYSIRLSADRVDSTKRIQDRFWTPGPRDKPAIDIKYITFGFSYIQDMIDEAIISLQTNRESRTGVVAQQFPYPCYIKDRFILAISRTIPLFMVLAWIFSVAMIVKGIVYEKEERLKEVMKMMGLKNMVHWCAWFINSIDLMFITSLLFLIIFKYGKVLEYSDPSVILVFLLSFLISTISLCFLISVFFSRANLAAVCSGFIYFMMYIPYSQFVLYEETMATSSKLLGCLLSNVAFGFSCTYIARYEQQAVGIQWSNINSSPTPGDTFNMAKCIMMMWVDTVIYGVLTWYIEVIKPGQYGIAKPWYFPFMKSYWCPPRGHDVSATPFTDTSRSTQHDESGNFEKEPVGNVLGVSIRNLKKVYSDGTVAVDDLCLNFYEGQITSFLGHNGAGKTTTMSILTGLFAPSDGTAYIYGNDIRVDMDAIRKSLGMCPQHNVLFDRLTVEEHLWFYSRLKGLDEGRVMAERERMLKDVGLVNKRSELVRYLSGGMKRKLSVAIAFVGNSQTVILDEPTAGVDPYARRSIWDLLLKYKRDHTVILTTHHMDEADILGDRIAIISRGKLKCCGSSLFLKNRFGSGYSLTLVRADEQKDNTEDALYEETTKADALMNGKPGLLPPLKVYPQPDMEDSTAIVEDGAPNVHDDPMAHAMAPEQPLAPIPTKNESLSEKRLTTFIKKFVPGSTLGEDLGTQISYQLPATSSEEFIELFQGLEMNYAELGISSYGISDTTLEEVFLNVADEDQTQKIDAFVPKKRVFPNRALDYLRRKIKRRYPISELLDDTDFEDSPEIVEETASTHIMNPAHVLTGWQLIVRQFVALIIKRFHHVRRSVKGFISEILLPAAFVCIAMLFAMLIPGVSEEPPLEIHPWLYEPIKIDPNLYMFYSNDARDKALGDRYERMLLSHAGVGTRCMDKNVYTIKGYPCDEGVKNQSFTESVPPSNYSLPHCSCKTGRSVCPADKSPKTQSGGPIPPKRYLETTDYLYNMTARNVSDWIKKTRQLYMKNRYGGLSFGLVNSLSKVNVSLVRHWFNRLTKAANRDAPLAANEVKFLDDFERIFERLAVQDMAKVWFNNKGWAALPAYTNVLSNLILRSHLPPGRDPAKYGITIVNHPMNFTKKQFGDRIMTKSVRDLAVAVAVIFAMGFIPASFTLYLIAERVSNSKHLQFVSGVNPIVYWVSTFSWDMVNFLIPAVLCMFIFLAFQVPAYSSHINAPCVMALLFFYGWASVPLMYPFSKIFSTPSYAFVVLSSGNVFLGIVSTLATFILQLLQEDDDYLKMVNGILKQVFLLLPQYCLGRGIIDLAMWQAQSESMAKFGIPFENHPFDWDKVGRNLFSLFLLGIGFFILNLLIEYHFFINVRVKSDGHVMRTDEEDEDVKREKRRVMGSGANDDVVKVENLTAVYQSRLRRRKNTAVNRLCLGVPRGQCFGLLGVNGAGKTSTFKMLTGDITPTAGSATINGHGIINDMNMVRRTIGYCPQFDALGALLTGREHLQLYARLRGISDKDIPLVCEWALEKLGLLQYADIVTSRYSGGNRRKLSTAIALIGNPPVIFLDEPTAGMDPKAKRALWTCINGIVKDGRSVILTSHSMEECEALCGRLAIMVNGEFKCIGSLQHIKHRFGSGYTLMLRVGEAPNGDASANISGVVSLVMSEFPGSELQEQHQNMLQFQVNLSHCGLSRAFSCLEGMRATYNIEDYSLSQTSLDQVFINFASNQVDLDDTDDRDTSSKKRHMLSCAHRDYDGLESVAGSTADLVTIRRPGSVQSTATEMTAIEVV